MLYAIVAGNVRARPLSPRSVLRVTSQVKLCTINTLPNPSLINF